MMDNEKWRISDTIAERAVSFGKKIDLFCSLNHSLSQFSYPASIPFARYRMILL